MSDLTLTEQQHDELSRLSNAGRTSTTPGVPLKKPARYPGVCRVIAMESRTYDSTRQTSLPMFVYDATGYTYSVEMIGNALAGYCVLVVNDTSFVLECRRENLDDIATLLPSVSRITVLPGLWQFESSEALSISMRGVNETEFIDLCALFDNDSNLLFNGSTVVRREHWKTVQQSAGQLYTVPVVDAIPYHVGQVRAGSIGVAQYAHDGGFIVTGWQCRTFSFAPGYRQHLDPTIND